MTLNCVPVYICQIVNRDFRLIDGILVIIAFQVASLVAYSFQYYHQVIISVKLSQEMNKMHFHQTNFNHACRP